VIRCFHLIEDVPRIATRWNSHQRPSPLQLVEADDAVRTVRAERRVVSGRPPVGGVICAAGAFEASRRGRSILWPGTRAPGAPGLSPTLKVRICVSKDADPGDRRTGRATYIANAIIGATRTNGAQDHLSFARVCVAEVRAEVQPESAHRNSGCDEPARRYAAGVHQSDTEPRVRHQRDCREAMARMTWTATYQA
jgi:hypothetical protein